MLHAGLNLTRDEFTAHQALSAKHVTFSLTEACPLRCSHCIVATVAPSDRSRTMSIEHATALATQLNDLVARKVEFISFTGGEPFLAPRQLLLLSTAALEAGLDSTVVTGCHWAGTARSARSMVLRYPGLRTWHLSTDEFHEEFVPVANVLNAARAAIDLGRVCVVRMAASNPAEGKSLEILEEVRAKLPREVAVFIQPVLRIGRGSSLNTDLLTSEVPSWPCVPNGMVVRWDCTVAPCCAGLVDQRDGHPFQYGSVDKTGLALAHQSWCTDPLLQLIRTVGFAPLIQWMREEFPQNSLASKTPTHPCECCTKIWRDPDVRLAMRRRAELPENRAKVAVLTEQLFGETFLRDNAGKPDLAEDSRLARHDVIA